MNGRTRFPQSTNPTIVRLCRMLLVALAAAAGTANTVLADKIFAHGAAGTGNPFSFKTEIVLGSNFVSANLLVPATGEVHFYRPNGTEMPLKVTGPFMPGPGCSGNVCTSFGYSVIGPTQFILESDDDISAFWTQVQEDQQDMTRATLKFILLEGATEVSVADVPPSDARERHGFFVTGPINPNQTRLTGIAISNPSGAQARYAAVALDGMGNQAATAEFFLGANQQASLFVNELFPGLPADFNGSVQVLSDRDSSSVALLQTIEDQGGGDITITISAIRTDDESAEPIPFLVGKAAEFGGGGAGGGMDFQVIASDTLQPRGQLGGGAVTLRRHNEVLRGTIAQDGSILIGPVPPGEWVLNIQVPGFLPFERPIDFPTTPSDISLIPLAIINPAFLAETLAGGRVFKPVRQFQFIFDVGSFERVQTQAAVQRIRQIHEAFKQWVFFELPQLRIPVLNSEGGLTTFGGRANYSEINFQSAPSTAELNTIIVTANFNETSLIEVHRIFSEEAFTLNGTTLRFLPETVSASFCEPNEVCDTARIVSAFFWDMVFFRNFAGINLDFDKVALTGLPNEAQDMTPVFTQITSNPQSFTATGLDNNYWRVLVRRPRGTLITPDGEFLPKAGEIPSSEGNLANLKKLNLRLIPLKGKD